MGKRTKNELPPKQTLVGYAQSGGWTGRTYHSTTVVLDERFTPGHLKTVLVDPNVGSEYPVDILMVGAYPVCVLHSDRDHLPPKALLDIVVKT